VFGAQQDLVRAAVLGHDDRLRDLQDDRLRAEADLGQGGGKELAQALVAQLASRKIDRYPDSARALSA
jgi:hypothetical protein